MGGSLGWRAAFLLEAAAMLPFVVFCLRAPPISLRGGGNGAGASVSHPHRDDDGSGEGAARPAGLLARLRGPVAAVGQDLRLLASHPIYLWNVGGMTVYTAVLGTFAFYGPKAGREMFDIQPERADLTFGAITVLTGERARAQPAGWLPGSARTHQPASPHCRPAPHLRALPLMPHAACARRAGTLGTLAGGTLLDAVGSSMRNALLLCTLGITLGGALSVAAFWAAGSFPLFSFVFALAQMAMFTSSVGGGGWRQPARTPVLPSPACLPAGLPGPATGLFIPSRVRTLPSSTQPHVPGTAPHPACPPRCPAATAGAQQRGEHVVRAHRAAPLCHVDVGGGNTRAGGCAQPAAAGRTARPASQLEAEVRLGRPCGAWAGPLHSWPRAVHYGWLLLAECMPFLLPLTPGCVNVRPCLATPTPCPAACLWQAACCCLVPVLIW